MIDSLNMYEELIGYSFTEEQAKGIINALERQEINIEKKNVTREEIKGFCIEIDKTMQTLFHSIEKLNIKISNIEKVMYGGFGIILTALAYLIFGK